MSRAALSRFYLAVCLLVIYWLALGTATHLPNYTSRELLFPHFDKLQHFAAYGVLGFLLAWGFSRLAPETFPRAICALLIGWAYGAVDEIWQLYIPGRQGDFFDWLADACGVACGVPAFFLARSLFRKYVLKGKTEQPETKRAESKNTNVSLAASRVSE